MKEALFYTKFPENKIKCNLCPHNCNIQNGKIGICGVRKNIDGILYSLVYEKPCAINIDPIEKKPLFHFYPGSSTYSIATVGCNFRCSFCQNYHISQAGKEEFYIHNETVTPSTIIKEAKKHNSVSISYTYTEPFIFYEYALDICKLAKNENLKNVFVSNGYINHEPLLHLIPLMDAANIDLKSFNDQTYKKIMGGTLEPVLNTIKILKEKNVWIEVTTLLIPDLNDSRGELEEIAKFLYNISSEIPWHISRFHPDYKYLNSRITDTEILHKAYEIGKNIGLKYVYTGNINDDIGEHTYCYNCKDKIISRFGFNITEYKIKDSKCQNCGSIIHGVGL
jgi:pyruvate formate lyase activating enzyme